MVLVAVLLLSLLGLIRRRPAWRRTREWRAAAQPRANRKYLAPSELAGLPPVFVGRRTELNMLVNELNKPTGLHVIVLAGPNGIGKTALAAITAARLAESFRGGTLLGDLGRRTDVSGRPRTDDEIVADVLQTFVAALRDPATRVRSTQRVPAEYFRAMAAQRRPVVVLDDADDPAVVERLLPTGADCAVLVTTPDGAPFRGRWPVLDLEPLAEEQSMDLIRAIVSETWANEDETCRRIVRAMHGHPNALRLTATQLANRSGSDVDALRRIYRDPAAELSAGRQRREHGAGSISVALQVSYNLLGDEERLGLRLVGCLDRTSFRLSQLSALVGTGEAATARVVERLLVAGFLSRTSTDQLGVPVFHISDDVLRFARQKFQEESKPRDRARLRDRLELPGREPVRDLDALIKDARVLLQSGELSQALSTVRRAVEWARAADDEREGLALATLAEVRVESGVAGPLQDFVQDILARSERHPVARLRAWRCAALLAIRGHDETAAREHLAEIVEQADAAEPAQAEELVLALLECARLDAGDGEQSLALVARAGQICATLPDKGIDLRARLLGARAYVLHTARRPADARAAVHEAERWALRRAQHLGLAWIAHDRAAFAIADDPSEEALRYARDALYAFSDMDHRYGRARAALLLARLHLAYANVRPGHADGHRRRAMMRWHEARDELSACGDPSADELAERLDASASARLAEVR